MDQRSEEWFKERLGKVTASRICDVMSKTKNGYGSSRQNYIAQLVCERLTGNVTDSYINAAMQRGIDLEDAARLTYEMSSGLSVRQVGIVNHPTIEWCAASPDGLVDDDGLVEIKCPNTWTHIEFLRSGKPENKYILQMQWQMACTDRKWCDFVSFDDRLPSKHEIKIIRIERDIELINDITREVKLLLNEVSNIIDELEHKCNAINIGEGK